MRRALLLTVLLTLGAPHTALAGTASIGQVTTDPKYGYTDSVLVFRAAPGEVNRIVVTAASMNNSPVFVVRDAGAPITASTGCTAIDVLTVRCAAGSAFIDAGDGNDVVAMPTAVTGRATYARGGDGADVLTGAGVLGGDAGNDDLSCLGECGPTTLAGGAGNDVLRGGNGNDVLSGDGEGPGEAIGYETVLTDSFAPGNDRIDGGAGLDKLTYSGRQTGVGVDLQAGKTAGASGDRDAVAGIEDVVGGKGDDILRGDGRDNTLEGNSGDDRLDGRGGSDYLLGHLIPDTNEYSVGYTPPDPGADVLRGREGDDRLDAGSEAGDVMSGGAGDDRVENGTSFSGAARARTVSCGSGDDTLAFAPQGQLITGCEQLQIDEGNQGIELAPQRRANGRLRFASTCPRTSNCVMAIGVRVRSSPLALRKITIRARGQRAFIVRPKRAARRGDIVEVRVVVNVGNTLPFSARWRVRV